jgi:oxygen-independent coproporphyrinogen III oxidase
LSGIYIHIPFCKQACTYCNFHFSTSLKLRGEMVEAIKKEILQPLLELRSFPFRGTPVGRETEEIDWKILSKEKIETIYFGGGTPSILTEDELKLIFDALKERFEFATNIEITLEANPDDITDEKLLSWKKIGINRLSVGLQSFNDEELKWMNRAHTAAESLDCIDKIKAAEFTNFSVDLIYGSPLLSDEDWKKNVQTIIEKDIPHISCYALTVEPKTALAKLIDTHKTKNTDSEKQAHQFLLLMQWLAAAGYEHYEISNFAKPNLRSQHNSSYWQGKKYYGFGPSAHSYFPNDFLLGESPPKGDSPKRKWNIANNALYIQSIQKNNLPYEEEILTPTQQLNEYIMTSLRTMEGLDLSYVAERFGNEFSTKLKVQSTKYINTNKVESKNSTLILTNEGKLFADGIAADLFF